jgi:hypothetical protein
MRLLLAVCVVLSACDFAAEDLPVDERPDAASPDAAPPVPADDVSVVLSPAPWEQPLFWPTVVGTSVTATATLTASADVTALEVRVTRAGYHLETDCPSALRTGDRCTLSLRFTPLGAGSYSGPRNLLVTWESALGPGARAYSLGGSGVVPAPPPGMVVAQAEVQLPPTVIGESSTLAVPVINTGHRATSTSIAAEAPAEMTITAPTCAAPVAPGAACQVDVGFAPTSWGCSTGRFRLGYDAPWVTVRGCAARAEARGERGLTGVGMLLADGDGWLFTHEPSRSYPGPGPSSGQLHRLLADGSLDRSFGDEGELTLAAETYRLQGLRALGERRFLWFGAPSDGGTDLAIVEVGVAGPLVHADCALAAAAVDDQGGVGLLCRKDGAFVLQRRHPDLGEDLGFGRVTLPATLEADPRLAFETARQRWVAMAYDVRDRDYDVVVATVATDGEGLASFALPVPYDFSSEAELVLPYVVAGGPSGLRIAALGEAGLDPAFGGGEIELPVGAGSLGAVRPLGHGFLAQLREPRDGVTGARWLSVTCDGNGVCVAEPEIAWSREALLRVGAKDGGRWLASGWIAGSASNWTYATVALRALLPDGRLDPAFANRDDATSHAAAISAPWQVATDGAGHTYVAALDVYGRHQEPRVTRYDSIGVRDPAFDVRLPRHRFSSVSFWDVFASPGSEALNGRNLALAVTADGHGLVASFDGVARTVYLDAFLPSGAPDPGYGSNGRVALPFSLDDDARFGGPFGILLARLPDGSAWVSINASNGLLRHISASGQPLGDWIDPGLYRHGALLADGDDVLVFGGTGSVRITPGGTRHPIAGRVDTTAIAAKAPGGGVFLASSSCVSRSDAGGSPAAFGDEGTLCLPGSSYDPVRALVIADDGSLEVYRGTHVSRVSADGQLLAQATFAPALLRDAVPGFVVGRDRQGRLILASGP